MPNAGDQTANSESALIVPEECRAAGGENSDETEHMLPNGDEGNGMYGNVQNYNLGIVY